MDDYHHNQSSKLRLSYWTLLSEWINQLVRFSIFYYFFSHGNFLSWFIVYVLLDFYAKVYCTFFFIGDNCCHSYWINKWKHDLFSQIFAAIIRWKFSSHFTMNRFFFSVVSMFVNWSSSSSSFFKSFQQGRIVVIVFCMWLILTIFLPYMLIYTHTHTHS